MRLSKTKTDVIIDETIPKIVVHSNFLRLYSDEVNIVSDIPVEQINSIIIMGSNYNIPARLIKMCNQYQIPLHLLTEYYKHSGSIYFNVHSNIHNRQSQFRVASNPSWTLYLSKLILYQKFQSQQSALNLWKPTQITSTNKYFGKFDTKLISKDNQLSLLGIEGIVASGYWLEFGNVVPKSFPWRGRIKNPCFDPVNSLLSLGYSLLATQCQTSLTLNGLDPYCGLLHTTNDDRPALTYDLMEIFRVWIVDLWVLELFHQKVFVPEDFIFTASGICTLRADKKNLFFKLWYRRLKHYKFDSNHGSITIHNFLITTVQSLIELFAKINNNQIRQSDRIDRLAEFLPIFNNINQFRELNQIICGE